MNVAPRVFFHWNKLDQGEGNKDPIVLQKPHKLKVSVKTSRREKEASFKKLGLWLLVCESYVNPIKSQPNLGRVILPNTGCFTNEQ